MSEDDLLPEFPMGHLSPSFISKYESCPLAALYYREGRPKQWDQRYAEIGSHTHSILEREYNTSAEIYIPSMMDAEMSRRHTEAMAGYEALKAIEPRYVPDRKVHHPEVHIRYRIGGVDLVGYIDLLTIRGKSPQIYIDDWKTGMYKPADEQQIRIYTMVISEAMGVSPRDITSTLCYLRESRGKIMRTIPYTSTAAIKRHIIDDVIEPINDLFFPAKWGKACERCESRHIWEAW